MQHDLVDRWKRVGTDTLSELGAPAWFATNIRQLCDFAVTGVDYQQPTEPTVAWPGQE